MIAAHGIPELAFRVGKLLAGTMVVYRDMSVSPLNRDVTIISNTGRPIVALYASLTSETSWGRTRGNLAPGAKVQAGFQQGAGCTIDIGRSSPTASRWNAAGSTRVVHEYVLR